MTSTANKLRQLTYRKDIEMNFADRTFLRHAADELDALTAQQEEAVTVYAEPWSADRATKHAPAPFGDYTWRVWDNGDIVAYFGSEQPAQEEVERRRQR